VRLFARATAPGAGRISTSRHCAGALHIWRTGRRAIAAVTLPAEHGSLRVRVSRPFVAFYHVGDLGTIPPCPCSPGRASRF
jgi:hypothetical protein